jgi:hypothetical protein
MKVGDILMLYFQENGPVNVIFENLSIQYSTEISKKLFVKSTNYKKSGDNYEVKIYSYYLIRILR